MALGLGLHREPPSGTHDTLLKERRRAVWWVVYCFDSGFSLTTGRPVMASDSFIETRLPLNVDDSVGIPARLLSISDGYRIVLWTLP